MAAFYLKNMNVEPRCPRWAIAFAVVALLFAHARVFADLTPADCGGSPVALVATRNGGNVFVAASKTNNLLVLDPALRKVLAAVPVPAAPSGLALSADEQRLYVTCAASQSRVCVIDVPHRKLVQSFPAGHSSTAPVLSPDGKTLFVCNRFNNDVSVFDLARGRETRRIAAGREPVAADITRDGRFLLVASRLPTGRADRDFVAATVSVVDVAAGKVVKELALLNGSGQLNDLRVSPDGRIAAVTHLVASFNRAATQVQFGWMNANALSLVDIERMETLYTLLLDTPDRGAANPWGLGWSADSKSLVVAHAGTHEVSVINVPELLAGISALRAGERAGQTPARRPSMNGGNRRTSVFRFLSPYEGLDPGPPFLVGARKRVKLPPGDLGPRAVAVANQTAYVGNYFSGTISVIGLSQGDAEAGSSGASCKQSIPFGPAKEPNLARLGEFYFHDVGLCLQGWQRCASCHPGDARVDGLNWDLVNDGIGSPKNTKSLLWCFQTPPAMSLGVRDTAATAVRAGIRHILFSEQPEPVAEAIGEYLKSLKPVSSPWLVGGKLSPAAKRGKRVFAKAGCGACHPPGLFTDLHSYDVGTRAPYEPSPARFDTPSLLELWRTAPYLHDGSAATVREVLTTRNPRDEHGFTSRLSPSEVEDLAAYLLSL